MRPPVMCPPVMMGVILFDPMRAGVASDKVARAG